MSVDASSPVWKRCHGCAHAPSANAAAHASATRRDVMARSGANSRAESRTYSGGINIGNSLNRFSSQYFSETSWRGSRDYPVYQSGSRSIRLRPSPLPTFELSQRHIAMIDRSGDWVLTASLPFGQAIYGLRAVTGNN